MQFTAFNFKCLQSDVGIPSRTIIKRFRNIYKRTRFFDLLSSLKVSGILSGRIQKVFIRHMNFAFRFCVFVHTHIAARQQPRDKIIEIGHRMGILMEMTLTF